MRTLRCFACLLLASSTLFAQDISTLKSTIASLQAKLDAGAGTSGDIVELGKARVDLATALQTEVSNLQQDLKGNLKSADTLRRLLSEDQAELNQLYQQLGAASRPIITAAPAAPAPAGQNNPPAQAKGAVLPPAPAPQPAAAADAAPKPANAAKPAQAAADAAPKPDNGAKPAPAAADANAKGCQVASSPDGPTLTLDTTVETDGKFKGTSTQTSGKVHVCVNDVEQADAASTVSATTDGKSGTFNQATALKGLNDGDKITVQGELASDTKKLGPTSNTVFVGTCSSVCDSKGCIGKRPTVDKVHPGDYRVTGKAADAKAPNVRVCVQERTVAVADVSPDGTFVAYLPYPLQPGDQVRVQTVSGDPTFGALSDIMPAGKADEAATIIMIGGNEWSGYSSLGQNSDAFLQLFYKGPSTGAWSGWGKIRLTSTPQPSTNGVVSGIQDPNGTITTGTDFTKVGQAFDFVAGPQYKLPGDNTWSVIAGVGATTPLTSNNVTLSYVAPPPGQECNALVARYSPAQGYHPGLTAAPSGSTTCLAGGITNIAFTTQDRSSLFWKYGAGFRTVGVPYNKCKIGDTTCTNAYAALDITVGQDASVTGGYLRHAVLRLDGVLPIPTGSGTSWLYLFGATQLRFKRNTNYDPLVLQAATGLTIPSASVAVLPLRIPDRDFYRLGVGLNINQLFCKLSSTTCPNKGSNPPASSTTPSSGAGSKGTAATPAAKAK